MDYNKTLISVRGWVISIFSSFSEEVFSEENTLPWDILSG